MTTTEKFFDAIAETAADIEDIVNGMYGDYQTRVSELLTDPAQRDTVLWSDVWEDSELDLLGVTEEVFLQIPIADLLDDPINERDMDWQRVITAMIAAAKQQAAMPAIRETLKAADKAAQRIGGAAGSMSVKELRNAARVGPGRARFETAIKQRDSDNV